MPSINTLVRDIYGLFQDGRIDLRPEIVKDFGIRLGNKIARRIEEERVTPSLRLSNLGKKCGRELWYSINHPEYAEKLSPEVRIKFSFGDILEEYLFFLAKESGHEVSDEQLEVNLFGVPGHIDGIIDGFLVDAKSASSFSFNRFANHLSPDDDSFGYITQLDSYLESLQSYSGLTRKDSAAFLVIDKTFGHICLDIHPKLTVDYKSMVDRTRAVLSLPNPPPRAFAPEPDGKSGNLKLGVKCSYCSFKHKCFTGLRTFIYSTGPRYLTRVERLPDVPEV